MNAAPKGRRVEHRIGGPRLEPPKSAAAEPMAAEGRKRSGKGDSAQTCRARLATVDAPLAAQRPAGEPARARVEEAGLKRRSARSFKK